MVKRQPIYNIHGERLTQRGNVDMRQFRNPFEENGGKAYVRYWVRVRETDARAYHIMSSVIDDPSPPTLISRHAKLLTAERECEKLRIRQPDRKPSIKERHKLGVK